MLQKQTQPKVGSDQIGSDRSDRSTRSRSWRFTACHDVTLRGSSDHWSFGRDVDTARIPLRCSWIHSIPFHGNIVSFRQFELPVASAFHSDNIPSVPSRACVLGTIRSVASGSPRYPCQFRSIQTD